jgi:hypothetical protein
MLVSAIGDAWQENEEWTFGLRVDRVTLPTAAEMNALVTAFSTFHQSTGASVGAVARLLSVKAAPIGVDGRYPVGADAVESVLATPVVGPSFTESLPQAALAVSLRTALSRGRGSKGRFYPPAYTQGAGAGGQITAIKAEDMRTAALALLGAIQDALLAPVVVGSKLGVGSLREVTEIRVGRVIDTQRRRRSSIPEAWVSAPLPP